MKSLFHAVLKFILLIFLALGCREEIINPETFVESVNSPVQISGNNSYTYLLTGQNFTSTLTIPSEIHGSSARISVTLFNYSRGYANIVIRDSENAERYRYFMAEEISMHSDVTEGYIPKTIEIRTFEFTGNLKITLTRNSF
jgi:hypothetical protein